MRLAIIAPHFPEYTLNYARAISKLHDVTACVDVQQLRDEYDGRDIPSSGFKLYRMKFKTPLDLLKLLYFLVRLKPNIVHFQEAVGPRRGVFNAIVATIMKPLALTVLTIHDPAPHAGRDVAAANKTAPARNYVRWIADLIVVHGEYCSKQLEGSRRHRRQRVLVSQHGLILEPASQLVDASGKFRLYFFGRMEAYKGIEILLLAAEILHENGLDFELAIEGKGPELDRLRVRFEQLPEVTIFDGFVPPNRIMASIQSADCVILPYLSATQSGVLSAAFAGRRYVIASDTGGFRDIVEHDQNGVLVPPGNPQALADAISRVCSDPALRRRLKTGAEATAVTKLDWDRISEELSSAFSKEFKFKT